MKKYIHLILFSILLLGCNKKDVLYVPAEVKQKYSFKKGSYWIYRDSISGRIDSCYLSTNQLFVPEKLRTESSYFEYLILGFVQKPIDTTINVQINLQLSFKSAIMSGGYANLNKQIIIDGFVCYAPIPLKDHTVKIKGTESNIYSLPNYTLGSNLFSNVSKIFANNQTIYINDSVGYIKMNIHYEGLKDTVNEVWELQRWNVIK